MKALFILALSFLTAFVLTVVLAVHGVTPIKAAAIPVAVVGLVSYFAANSLVRVRRDLPRGLVRAYWLPLLVAAPGAFWVFDQAIEYQTVAAWLAVVAGGLNIALNYFSLVVIIIEELNKEVSMEVVAEDIVAEEASPIAVATAASNYCGSCRDGCHEFCSCHCHPGYRAYLG